MVSKKIADGIRSQMKSIVKQGGSYPFLVSLGGMFFAAAVAFCFTPFSGDKIWLELAMLLLLILSIALITPFLYGASLCAADGTRYQGDRKYGLSVLFRSYYKGNYGYYNLWTVFWKSFLTVLATELIAGIVLGILFVTVYRGTYEDIVNLLNAYAELKQNETLVVTDYLSEADISLLRTVSYFLNAAALLTVTVVAFKNLFRDDGVFFAANVLVGENKINTVTPPIRNFFKKEILPSVKKEHFSLCVQILWPLYLASFLLYALLVFVFYYACGNNAFMILAGPFVAAAIAYLLSAPLYYFRKLYEALFYIAYAHVIENRLSGHAKSVLEEGRRALAPAVERAKEAAKDASDGSSSQDGDSDSSETKDDYTRDEDGTFDFTHDDDDSSDDDKKNN